jgi:hypothetical protein
VVGSLYRKRCIPMQENDVDLEIALRAFTPEPVVMRTEFGVDPKFMVDIRVVGRLDLYFLLKLFC